MAKEPALTNLTKEEKISMKKNRIKDNSAVVDTVIVVVMFISAIITLYPFLNVAAISFNDAVDSTRGGITIFPRIPTLANYTEIFKTNDLLPIAFFNSILRTVLGTVLGVVSSAVVAYTLSRRDFFMNKFVAILLVITMYVGGGLIPEYLLNVKLHLNQTFWVYLLPGLISPFNVIVIRSFMDNLPHELHESATLDGANDIVIFAKIIFPLCMPVIATVALFIAVGQWNSWFDTYIYNAKVANLTTLQFELKKVLEEAAANASYDPNKGQQIANQVAKTNPEAIKMAITMIATVPIVIVYPFLQKYFVSGMIVGAVKS